METYLNIMLIRFGIIAGIVVVVAIVVFAVALVLRRQGKLGAARRAVAPALRNLADSRSRRMAAMRGSAQRPDWVGGAARAAATVLERPASGGRDDEDASNPEPRSESRGDR